MASETVTLTNPSGLHARPASVFAASATGHAGAVSVTMGARRIPYGQAPDVRELADRIRRHLIGDEDRGPGAMTSPAIVIAETLTAAETREVEPADGGSMIRMRFRAEPRRGLGWMVNRLAARSRADLEAILDSYEAAELDEPQLPVSKTVGPPMPSSPSLGSSVIQIRGKSRRETPANDSIVPADRNVPAATCRPSVAVIQIS